MNRELHSWKEIAEYLGVTPRTAQKWEKGQGLPVRRLPGCRGRVLALREELDQWKLSGKNANGDALVQQQLSPATSTSINSHRIALIISIAVVVVAFLFAYWFWFSPGHPARCRIEGSTLIVSDARDREVWRWSEGYPLGTTLNERGERQCNFLWIGDLYGDSETETLFIPFHNWAKGSTSTPLICFDEKGRERWRFTPGRKVSSGREEFPDSYQATNFMVAPMGRGRPNSILLSSIHMPDYPCQIALLDPRSGRLVREYWHSGYIGEKAQTMQLADLDGDGVYEIYLAGANNARGAATLVVLHPDRFDGASWEENDDYTLKGMPPGREIRRVIFPHACLHEGPIPGAGVAIIIGRESLFVRVQDGNDPVLSLNYYFSPEGIFQKISPTDSFLQEHEAALRTRKIDHSFTRDELRSLERGVIVLPSSFELAATKH